MTPADDIAEATERLAVIYSDARPGDWTREERDLVLRSLGTVSYEVVGLSARIRAAKVNDTKVPHPVKPAPKPPPPPPADPPKDGA